MPSATSRNIYQLLVLGGKKACLGFGGGRSCKDLKVATGQSYMYVFQ